MNKYYIHYLPKDKILEVLYKEIERCENDLAPGFDLDDSDDFKLLIHYTSIMEIINDIERFYKS